MDKLFTLYWMFIGCFSLVGVLGIFEKILEKPLERIVDMLDLDD